MVRDALRCTATWTAWTAEYFSAGAYRRRCRPGLQQAGDVCQGMNLVGDRPSGPVRKIEAPFVIPRGMGVAVADG